MNIKYSGVVLMLAIQSIAYTAQPRPIVTPTPTFKVDPYILRVPNFQGQPCIVPRPVYDHKTKTAGPDTSVPGTRCVAPPPSGKK